MIPARNPGGIRSGFADGAAGALVVPESWRAAGVGLAAMLSELAFDAGRLRRLSFLPQNCRCMPT